MKQAFLSAILFATSAQAGVVLTFDQSPTGQTFTQDGYGDRVTTTGGSTGYQLVNNGYGLTPNVLATWSPDVADSGNRWNQWNTGGYGDLAAVGYHSGGSGGITTSIRFTADPGYQVHLFGFDMASWSVFPTTAGIGVYNQTGNLTYGYVTGPLSSDDPAHEFWDLGTGYSGDFIEIQFTFAEGQDAANFGVSNIHIGQSDVSGVPEPATLMLCGAGLVAALLARRMRRQAL